MHGEGFTVDVERLGLVADFARQLGQLDIGLAEGRPGFAVRLALEQFFQPPVEIGRAFEQLGPQAGKFLFLHEQVFADFAVKELDRVHREAESLLFPQVGGLELGVGPCLHGDHGSRAAD